MIILNFKAYKEAIGECAVKLANIAKEVKEKTNTRIIIAPQTTDILRTSSIIETIAQHVDAIDPGFGTGFLLADSVLHAGAIGSILNHSEHRIDQREIQVSISKLHELGLKSFICAQTAEEAKQIALLDPDYILIEPPELVGTGIAVSKAKPELITSSIAAIKQINKKVKILCGAGISNKEDVKMAMKLGVDGVGLASAFVKAKNPKEKLLEIVSGLK